MRAELQSAAEAENGLAAAMDAVEDDLTCLPVDKEHFANQNILEMERKSTAAKGFGPETKRFAGNQNQADNLRLGTHQTARGNTIGLLWLTMKRRKRSAKKIIRLLSTTGRTKHPIENTLPSTGQEPKNCLSVQREELQEVLEEYDEEAAKQHTLERRNLASNLELQKINNVAEITGAGSESCIRNIRKRGNPQGSYPR